MAYDDAIGNPLNDGTWTYTWQNGRQLARMQKTGVDASFVYNENGLRVQKTVNGVVTDYTLHGKNIVHMKQGSNNLHFFYDAQSRPAVVVYNGTAYSYTKNLQGDIVAILNSAGTVVVSYVYDAWGRPISCTGTMATTLGKLNPFRCRGYVFDEETKIYYLQSRYYSPYWNRFINTDNVLGIGCRELSHNAFAYCMNKPVTHSDPSGHYLCVDLYLYAINEAERDANYDFTDSIIGGQFTQCLLNSEVFCKALWTAMKEQLGNEDIASSHTFSFSIAESDYPPLYLIANMNDLDLFFAVRKCEVTITLTPSTCDSAEQLSSAGLYIFDMSYTLTDTFDFEKLSPATGNPTFVQWFNDTFGYAPQEAGRLNPFSFSVSGEMCLITGLGVFDLTK